ncbi:MAG: GPW/gp25 family protein [Synergistaceae bacterium]|nr:GPW/gp25 family protein [Synergistaceae bacterium]MBQ3449573.1 GPW/gp25 family protein [Synergistaceae bacterium]MBQ6110934.1 GPW/gp25 family protein [Synergistaceae bacterium]
MELDVSLMPEEINFAPANVIEEVVQNVRTICTTSKYSVPMDRLFGVDAVMLDRPTPRAMAAMQAEIVQAIRKYEPRCKVKRVSFDGDLDGRLNVKVRIDILEE